MSAKKVVIIGAGCAGLSAAYSLRKQGVEAVVYEASGVVGGRCRTVYEQGYEFIAGAGGTEPQWSTTFQYLEELGLLERVYSAQKQVYGFYRKGRIRKLFLGGSFWEMLKALPGNLAFIFTAVPLKTFPQVLKVFRALRKYMKLVDTQNHNFDALAEISNMSTEQFVLQYGGPEALEYIFHPFLSMMVLARPKEISIVHPISLFSLMKGMRSLYGGMGVITAGLYEKVNDCVRLNTPVKKVVIKDGKVVGVETRDGFVEADQVICGVDAVNALQLIPGLPEAMRKPLETCKYSSTYYYQFGLAKPLLKKGEPPFHIIMMPASEKTILDFASLGSISDEKPVVIMPTRGWEDEKLAALDSGRAPPAGDPGGAEDLPGIPGRAGRYQGLPLGPGGQPGIAGTVRGHPGPAQESHERCQRAVSGGRVPVPDRLHGGRPGDRPAGRRAGGGRSAAGAAVRGDRFLLSGQHDILNQPVITLYIRNHIWSVRR